MPFKIGNKLGHKNGPAKIAIGLRVEKESLEDIDAAVKKSGAASRNEFIEDAAVDAAKRILKCQTA